MKTLLPILVVVLLDKGTCSVPLQRDQLLSGVNFANFKVEAFHRLTRHTITSTFVTSPSRCGMNCLNHWECFSFNFGEPINATHHTCELVRADKYNVNSTNYIASQEHHHFIIKNRCMEPNLCQNEGKCLPIYEEDDYRCLCLGYYTGNHCEDILPTSCQEQYDKLNSSESQVFPFKVGSRKVSVYCHMGQFGCGDGGWTLTMKINGSKSTFHYDSQYWSDKSEYNLPGGKTGFDTQETKLPTYWNTPFSKICLGMKIDNQLNFIVINQTANSLYSLIADGVYRATLLGRSTWMSVIGSQATLQQGCYQEGFNAICTLSKARIGINSNDDNYCAGCDSRIGFGTAGDPDDSNSCGNEAAFMSDGSTRSVKAMGYILIQ